MPRNRKTPERVEIVPPTPQHIAEDYKRLIARMVEERVAEVLNESAAAELEPFFQPREVSYAIRRQQSVVEQRKWHYYFEAWGCLVCERKDVAHAALGMCKVHLARTLERLRVIKRQHQPDEVPEFGFKDGVVLARQALLPSIEGLASKRRPR